MSYHQHPRFTPPAAKSVVAPLPRNRRRFLFWSLMTMFICSVPIFVFYASGYRYDVFSPDATIIATGGLYVSVDNEKGELFLNNERVEDSRIFRRALYIQNLNPGLQRLHVQSQGYHAWVKELPVYPHIVTEVSAFLMPLVPQIRPISEYMSGESVIYLGVSSSTQLFSFASSSVPLLATSSKSTTTLSRNTEYTYVRNLFATNTATTTEPFINRVVDEARDIFDSSKATTSTSSVGSLSVPTTTVIENEMMLMERGKDVIVRYVGSERTIPYYFCIPDDMATTTSSRYQAQIVAARQALAEEMKLEEEIETTTTADRKCRREITIDRQNKNIISFMFMPGTTDLVLIHREDGVFVTEVDDRAWQNTQQIYPATADHVVIDGGRIYVQEGAYYLELLTELPSDE